jgi:hypothetical protein
MRLAPLVFALALALPAGALAAPPVEALRALAHRADLAQMHGDRAELERLIADDFRIVGGSGKPYGKAGLIALFTDPAVTLEPYEVREPFLIPLCDDAAVLGGLVTFRGLDHGRPYSQTFRYADTWLRRKGRWQVVYTQVTNLAP